MSKERSYLDDLPGVSGYAFGKFHLDDLDFADDPLKRKIDFIDDALLAPPKPGADITSGLKTTREVMGERKAQPTDKVGMRPVLFARSDRKIQPTYIVNRIEFGSLVVLVVYEYAQVTELGLHGCCFNAH